MAFNLKKLDIGLALLLMGLSLAPAQSHITACPNCSMDVVQDTKTQDNEVAIQYGRKRIEYRCIACAFAQAKTDYKNDLTILAPSEIKGRPVLISRTAGKWSALPSTTVFVGENAGHEHCFAANRAFSSKAAFQTYIAAHHVLLGSVKPLTLAQMVALSGWAR